MALIDHAAAAIAPLADDIVIVGRSWPGLRSVPDRPAPGLGPLGGIAGALSDARARGFDAVLSIGCDMPGVPPGLIRSLVASGSAYCPEAPILGVWRAAGAEALAAHLAGGGNRSVRAWAARIGATPVASPMFLRNVNTPADLEQ